MGRFRTSLIARLDHFIGMLTLTDTTLAEFQSSTTLLFFAFIFLNPWPTLTALPDPYSAMSRVMSEREWGAACLVLGGWQSAANWQRNGTGRKVAAFIACLFFSFISVLLAIVSADVASGPIFFGVPTRPVIPCLLVMSFVQALVYLRLSLRAAQREREGARLVRS